MSLLCAFKPYKMSSQNCYDNKATHVFQVLTQCALSRERQYIGTHYTYHSEENSRSQFSNFNSPPFLNFNMTFAHAYS
jgi:hypothetical protein